MTGRLPADGQAGAGTGMELQVIAAAVIGGANLAGGIGTAFGALIGSALIEVIRNSLGLLGISAFWQGAFVGAFIIIAVSFDRSGTSASPNRRPRRRAAAGRFSLISLVICAGFRRSSAGAVARVRRRCSRPREVRRRP